MEPHKKRKALLITMSVTLVVGIIAYAAADRYLIQHVEIADVNLYNTYIAAALTPTTGLSSSISPTVSSTPSIVNSTQPAVSDTQPVTATPNPAAATTRLATATLKPTRTPVPTVTADDWHYSSATIKISIDKITTGSGDATITYFLADVTLKDATQLKSAFAKNMFGRNIIENTSVIAQNNNAIFAINGDYYGFRTTGIELRNGILYRDVPTRIGLAQYRDGTMRAYDETTTTGAQLLAAGAWNTLSFGPALLVKGAIPDGIETAQVDTSVGYTIQGDQPRTGIGIIDVNHYIFIVVDGRSAGYSKGVDMTEFAVMFQDLGCTDAYNIDGGGSATMYFRGRVVNNPLGKNRERGTSDILYIG